MKCLLPLLALLAFIPQRSSADTLVGLAIAKVPVVISIPGVYHFTKNLTYAPATGAAITITGAGTVIDLNGYQLISGAGAGNAATGILCTNVSRVTVRNGKILGFENGVFLTSGAATVRDLLLTTIFKSGITVIGNNAEIIHNHICDTGGSAFTTGTTAAGITLTGSFGYVSDNDIQHTFTSDTAGRSATGILLRSCSNVVLSSNRVLDVEPFTPVNATSTGISVPTSDPSINVILIGNIVTDSNVGFDLSGVASGKYGDNITSGNGNDYNTTGSGIIEIPSSNN